jgi:hypothetical protein
MRIHLFAAATVALGLVSAPSHADNAGNGNGMGFGVCKSGFAQNTVVSTEARGNVTIDELKVGDRVWSYNEIVGKPGWSKVLRRLDAGPSYRILADFTQPGSTEVTKACWLIKTAG